MVRALLSSRHGLWIEREARWAGRVRVSVGMGRDAQGSPEATGGSGLRALRRVDPERRLHVPRLRADRAAGVTARVFWRPGARSSPVPRARVSGRGCLGSAVQVSGVCVCVGLEVRHRSEMTCSAGESTWKENRWSELSECKEAMVRMGQTT